MIRETDKTDTIRNTTQKIQSPTKGSIDDSPHTQTHTHVYTCTYKGHIQIKNSFCVLSDQINGEQEGLTS